MKGLPMTMSLRAGLLIGASLTFAAGATAQPRPAAPQRPATAVPQGVPGAPVAGKAYSWTIWPGGWFIMQ